MKGNKMKEPKLLQEKKEVTSEDRCGGTPR